MKKNICNVDILVSVSFFKALMPARFHERYGDDNLPLKDSVNSWNFQKDDINQWVESFQLLIEQSISFAVSENSLALADRRIHIPALATNFPNLSNASNHDFSEELWKRSVIALACCMVACHKMNVRVIEVISGSLLDKRKGDKEKGVPWKIKIPMENRDEVWNTWAERFAKGIRASYAIARLILKRWPDVAIAIEMEPEENHIASSPDKQKRLAEIVREYIREHTGDPIPVVLHDQSDDFRIAKDLWTEIQERAGLFNIDFGHVALFLQRTVSPNRYKLSNELERFCRDYEWEWAAHSHLSDHGLLHNKDRVPLSILPVEFYLPLLKKYKEICRQQKNNKYYTKTVALELEAATTAQIGAGYNNIFDILNHDWLL